VAEGEKRSVPEMLGEFLRETSVLVLVFVPLELYTQHAASLLKTICVVFLTSTILLVLGMWLERSRR
jgi:hypothetical protein